MKPCHVALVGATGIVGQEVLRLLEERDFRLEQLTLLASGHSAGTRLEFRNRSHVVRQLGETAFTGVDIAIFTAGAETSRAFARRAVTAGAVVIDSSSAWRLDPQVPLCVPEVNGQALARHHGIVALPHSLTTQVVLALAPLQGALLKRVAISTYQALSGMGGRAVQEFDQQLRDLLNFRPLRFQVWSQQMAFNCVPHCGAFQEHGYTEDELALVNETRKILDLPELPVTATAVWVPLSYGHAAAVSVETSRPLSPEEARARLAPAPGIVVEDDCARQLYPSTIRANGQDAVFVGRIRADLSVAHGLHLWVVADNLRRGVALTAVQVAERLVA